MSLQLRQISLDHVHGLLFDLLATEVGNHLALVWQVELLLVADHIPSLLIKDAKSINGQVGLSILRLGQKDGARMRFVKIEATLQSLRLRVELGLHVELV